MINFIQLHQGNNYQFSDFLITDKMWEKLHDLFLQSSQTSIRKWILDTSVKGNVDIKTIIKHYFNYMIQHHSEYITKYFLDIVENIVHHYDTNMEYLLFYFIEHVFDYYCNYKKN
jgi:hypothetical protein